MPSATITTMCLVRHGETDWNVARRYQGWSDIPLNDVGLAQAELVARVIADEPEWHAIVSSPLSRAMQTAQAIAKATGLGPITEDPDLRERGYGEGEGLLAIEREARWPGEDWPGLEPYDTMLTRAMGAMERIATRHAGERVLVVSHGGLMNGLLGVISNGIHGRGTTVIQNTARTTILREGSEWRITVVTDASHLEVSIR